MPRKCRRIALAVDDDEEFLARLSQFLQSASFEVLQAGDGKQAMSILEKMQSEIDLAIIDLSLPEVNGFEVIGAMTRHSHSIKIVAASCVYRESYLKDAARTLGADAVFEKPRQGQPIPEENWLSLIRELVPEESSTAGRMTG